MSAVLIHMCVKCGALKSKREYCKDCARRRGRCTYMHNRDRWIGYQEKRMTNHGDEVRAYIRNWKKNEKYLAHNREYCAQWRKENPNYEAEWREKNPERSRLRSHNYRMRKYNAFGSHSESEWLAIVAKQKGRCAECKLKRTLERDHIVPITLGGSDMAVNIQGLCRSCNARKSNTMQFSIQLSVFDRVAV